MKLTSTKCILGICGICCYSFSSFPEPGICWFLFFLFCFFLRFPEPFIFEPFIECPVHSHTCSCTLGCCLCQRGAPRLHREVTSVSADCSCGTRHVWLGDYTASYSLNPSLPLPKPAQGQSPRSVQSPHTHTHTPPILLTSRCWQPFLWNQELVWPWSRRSHEVRRGWNASMTFQFVVMATWRLDDKPGNKSAKAGKTKAW